MKNLIELVVRKKAVDPDPEPVPVKCSACIGGNAGASAAMNAANKKAQEMYS
jgi:hypothetical protein